jgi:hypothetical protein
MGAVGLVCDGDGLTMHPIDGKPGTYAAAKVNLE